MYPMLEHPEVSCALRTGYPSWMNEEEDQEAYDEDALYDEQREDRYGW